MTREQALQKAYLDVFAGPEGDLVLSDLIDFCHDMRTTEVPDHPEIIHALEGRRAVLKHMLWRMGKTSPIEWARAIKRMVSEEIPERQEVSDGPSNTEDGEG